MASLSELYGEVYVLTCVLTGKQYVGQTTRGASVRWEAHKLSRRFAIGNAIKAHGPEAFTLKILDTARDQPDLDAKEIYWIAQLDTVAPCGYNLKKGGLGGGHTPDTIRKISERKRTPEEIEKSRSSRRGQKRSETSRQRMSAARQGMSLSEDHRKNISQAGRRRLVSEETRQRISQALKGKSRTPEAIEATRKGRWGK